MIIKTIIKTIDYLVSRCLSVVLMGERVTCYCLVLLVLVLLVPVLVLLVLLAVVISWMGWEFYLRNQHEAGLVFFDIK